MKKVFWISSYPKSGNTWMRAIISAIFFSQNGKFNFDLLKNIQVFDQKLKYNFVKEKSISEYNNLNKLKIISQYRIGAQQNTYTGGDFAFYKTHSSNISINGYNYTNDITSRGLIYLIRDPRDVVISYSKHNDQSIDETIKIMTDQKCLDFFDSLPFLMSSWDKHYLSWEMLKVPKIVIKYEDLLVDTRKIILKILDFFSTKYNFRFNNSDLLINNLIESTKFSQFQKYEKLNKFSEKPSTSVEKFFRKGSVGQWKSILTEKQSAKIEFVFKELMNKFDYL